MIGASGGTSFTDLFSYMGAHWGGADGLLHRLVQHLGYSVEALALSALIALPLGLLFTEGEQNDFLTEVLAGVVLVLFWALVFDILIVTMGRALTPWARRRS